MFRAMRPGEAGASETYQSMAGGPSPVTLSSAPPPTGGIMADYGNGMGSQLPGQRPQPMGRQGRSGEVTDYLRPGSMLSTAQPQAQPGSVTAAIQAMRQGSPMAMDMLRQSAGLPGAQIGTASSQGQMGPQRIPPPMGGGMQSPYNIAAWNPGFAQQFRQNLWSQQPMAAMAGGYGGGMGGPMPGPSSPQIGQWSSQGQPPPQPTFQQFAQQQPYPSGKLQPYGPFMNPQSPASLFRQQQLLAQFYGMQPGF